MENDNLTIEQEIEKLPGEYQELIRLTIESLIKGGELSEQAARIVITMTNTIYVYGKNEVGDAFNQYFAGRISREELAKKVL